MKCRPILFTGAMVRALLAGSKTQTRRLMKPQPLHLTGSGRRVYKLRDFKKAWQHVPGVDESLDPYRDCPYGRPGDRLWVRETWGYTRQCDDINGPGDVVAYAAGHPWLVYEGEGKERRLRETSGGAIMQPNHWCDRPAKWRPSIHMPRWASRIMLELTEIRAQRLQEISGHDVLAEGVDNGKSNPAMGVRWENMQRMAFEELWTSINGASSWAANPWVWAIAFTRAV